MESIRRGNVPIARLPGRDVQRIVGRGAALTSERMTVGTARYSDEAGSMEPHHHAEETIFVLDATGGPASATGRRPTTCRR